MKPANAIAALTALASFLATPILANGQMQLEVHSSTASGCTDTLSRFYIHSNHCFDVTGLVFPFRSFNYQMAPKQNPTAVWDLMNGRRRRECVIQAFESPVCSGQRVEANITKGDFTYVCGPL